MPSQNKTAKDYVDWIDGLRALAVVSVVVFHLNLKLVGNEFLESGYLGVDIFFVISGFLITRNLLVYSSNSDDIFGSILKFYQNRTKRILPVAVFYVFVAIVLAYFYLLPGEFQSFAESAISVFLFVGNIYYYANVDYFRLDESNRVLLHYWSLAVEEQFYLIFAPFIFIFMSRLKSVLNAMLISVFAVSLLFYFVLDWQDNDAGFYLTPFRAWQFAAGALVATLNRRFSEAYHHQDLILSISFSLILVVLFWSSKYGEAKAILPLLVTIATSILLLKHELPKPLNDILTNKIVRYIGKISFSVYLSHWIVMYFTRKIGYENVFAELAIIISISIFSYHFVEVPFRYKIKSSFVYFSSFLAIFLGTMVCIHVAMNNGLPNRWSSNNFPIFETAKREPLLSKSGYSCFDSTDPCVFGNGPVSIGALGDSHIGTAISKIIYENLDLEQFQFIDYSLSSTGFWGGGIFSVGEHQTSMSGHRFIALKNMKPTTWVVANRYPFYLSGQRPNNCMGHTEPGPKVRPAKSLTDRKLEDQFFENVKELVQSGHKFVFIDPIPEMSINVPDSLRPKGNLEALKGILARPIPLNHAPKVPRQCYEKRVERTKDMLGLVSTLPGVERLDISKYLCDEQWCYSVKGGKVLYYDYNHLSRSGSSLLMPEILEKLKNLADVN